MTKKNQYYLEYIIFRLFEFFIRLVPSIILPQIAKAMAFIAFKIIKYRRQVALDNLAVAFPEKREKERFMIAYQSVEHFILVILEFMKLSKWNLNKLQRKVHIDKPEMFDTILKGNQDKGVIFVSGHFGNWEIPIAFLAEGHFPQISIIQQRQNNYLIDQHLTNIRARRGMKIYYTGDAIKNGLEDLKKNGMVAIVCDQDAGVRGVFIPFFGRMASTPIGAALLHLHSKSRLIFAASVRTGHFRIVRFY